MTTRWARLTWQVPDAERFARELAATLGTEARPGGLAPGASLIVLADAILEVRPWIRESATDEPRDAGRLMLEPVPEGDRIHDEGGAHGWAPGLALAGVGWATVDLDRADADLGQWLGEPVAARRTADPHLGAAARVRAGGGLPGERFVLLEPSTEGRVAASLARDGEGPCALYLRPSAGLTAWSREARTRGVHLGVRRLGPLGASVLVLGGPASGPHLLLVDALPATKAAPAASTIAP